MALSLKANKAGPVAVKRATVRPALRSGVVAQAAAKPQQVRARPCRPRAHEYGANVAVLARRGGGG
jgi:hypothetical protein